jgi:hypothetical protein
VKAKRQRKICWRRDHDHRNGCLTPYCSAVPYADRAGSIGKICKKTGGFVASGICHAKSRQNREGAASRAHLGGVAA